MMRMRIVLVALLVALELASLFNFGLASPSTVPAFLWSTHLQSANGEMDEAVNYQVMSAKNLVDSVFTRGGWSNFMCSEKKLQQPVDVALVFIGRESLGSCMVDLMGRSGLHQDAYGLIKEMPMDPSSGVWGALLGACRVLVFGELCLVLERD